MLHVLQRPHAEFLLAETILIESFGQVGVQAHLRMSARQFHALSHQFPGDAEGGTGCQPDAAHRKGVWVMELLDHAQAVIQDIRLAVADAIRRQATLALAEAHAAASRMEADTHLLGRRYLVVQPRAVGKQVEMIGHGSGAGKQQLGQTQTGADKNALRIHFGPHRVQGFQPVEQRKAVAGAQGPGQGLVEMMMTIDQARQQHATAGVDDLIRRDSLLIHPAAQRGAFVHAQDRRAIGQQCALLDLAALLVHGHQHAGVFDQNLHAVGSRR